MATSSYALKQQLGTCVETLGEGDTLSGELAFDDFMSDADHEDYDLLGEAGEGDADDFGVHHSLAGGGSSTGQRNRAQVDGVEGTSRAAAGWSTYAGMLSVKADSELDLEEIEKLMARILTEIHSAPNRVKYTMNYFVIAVGGYVRPLLKRAKSVAKQLGQVKVDMGNTECKVPMASAYIEKMESAGRIGKKRKTLRC